MRLAISPRLVGTTCLLLAAAHCAHAWNSSPAIGTTVSNAPATSSVRAVVADGQGGAFIAWEDAVGATFSARVQHLDWEGRALWTANGVLAATSTGNLALAAALVPDDAGGVILVTAERRNAPTAVDIFAQRFGPQGARLWGTNGVTVCGAATDQITPVACGDGAGGVIVAWDDARNTATTGQDLFAQRVDSAGVARWVADGAPVIVHAALQQRPVMIADGAGGAIVVWEDSRTSASSGVDLYGQRLRGSDGARQWTATGAVVSGATGGQVDVRMIADGSGGAILAWVDNRTPANSNDIYAEHLGASGERAAPLPENIPVCTDAASQSSVELASDGLGGAILAWADGRGGSSAGQVFAQRLLAGTTTAWTANGVALQSTAFNLGRFPAAVIPDEAGGAIVVWNESSHPFAQRLNSAGALQWTAAGVGLATYFPPALPVGSCGDGRGGVIGAYSQVRDLTLADVFAVRTDRYGFIGSTEPAITGVGDVPNDQGGRVKLEWDASYLEFDGLAAVTSYNVFRSVPAAQLAAKQRAGAALTADPDRMQRDPANHLLLAQDYAYELIGTVSALDVPSYSFIATTLGDSTGGSNPPTAFMVQARGASSRYWSSAPDSGYSVDNLAPAAPTAFAGFYTGGVTRLSWAHNHETDLAGYRVYRGIAPDFATDAAHLVASPPDTGYVDAAGAPFHYKLTAVDAHGNESAASLSTPVGVLSAPGSRTATLALAAPSPNPARGTTRIRFTLPMAGRAALVLVDLTGRVVAHRVLGPLGAGEHAASLALERDDGRPLPAGLYWLRLRTGDTAAPPRRIAVVR